MASEKAQLAAIARELRQVTAGTVRDIGRGVMDAAIAGTPTASGLTQANWIASRGRPVSEPVGTRSRSGVAKAKAAQEASRAELDAYELANGALNISNAEGNVERINDGGTANAPGFVQRAIVKGLAVGGAAATARAAAASRRGGGGR